MPIFKSVIMFFIAVFIISCGQPLDPTDNIAAWTNYQSNIQFYIGPTDLNFFKPTNL